MYFEFSRPWTLQLESADSKNNTISKYLLQDSFWHFWGAMRKMHYTFWKKASFRLCPPHYWYQLPTTSLRFYDVPTALLYTLWNILHIFLLFWTLLTNIAHCYGLNLRIFSQGIFFQTVLKHFRKYQICLI